jgi:hypothetical protein
MNLGSKFDILRGTPAEGIVNLTVETEQGSNIYAGTIVALTTRQLPSAKVLKMVDDTLDTAPTLTSSDRGKAYVVAGTEGAWSDFSVGDIVEWDGTDWNLIVANDSGIPPALTAVVVVNTSAAGSFETHENEVMYFDGEAWKVAFTPVNKNHIKIDGQGSVYYNMYFDYSGNYPDGFWYKPILQNDAPVIAKPAEKTLSPYFWAIVIRGQDNFDSAFLNKVTVIPLHAGTEVKIGCAVANTLTPGSIVAVDSDGVVEGAGSGKVNVGVVLNSNGKSGADGEIVFVTF